MKALQVFKRAGQDIFSPKHHIIIQTGSRYCHGAGSISHTAPGGREGGLLPDLHGVRCRTGTYHPAGHWSALSRNVSNVSTFSHNEKKNLLPGKNGMRGKEAAIYMGRQIHMPAPSTLK